VLNGTKMWCTNGPKVTGRHSSSFLEDASNSHCAYSSAVH
jgi:hypothetical protein